MTCINRYCTYKISSLLKFIVQKLINYFLAHCTLLSLLTHFSFFLQSIPLSFFHSYTSVWFCCHRNQNLGEGAGQHVSHLPPVQFTIIRTEAAMLQYLCVRGSHLLMKEALFMRLFVTNWVYLLSFVDKPPWDHGGGQCHSLVATYYQ